MTQRTYYWRWSQAIPKAVCEAALAEMHELEVRAGRINGTGAEVVDTKIRDCKINFLPVNHWIEGVLANHCRYANVSAGWGFDIRGTQQVQLARYGVGEFYKEHADSNPLDGGDQVRKLTAVLLLSPKDDFAGGALTLNGDSDTALFEQGDLVVFPSFVRHEVHPTTSGVRCTATLWMTGPNFV